jgi:hypothetical protein
MRELVIIGKVRHILLTGLTGAGVHLECLLIRVDVELDAGPLARQSRNGSSVVPVIGAVLGAVYYPAGVITSAVESAVAERLWCGEIGTDLLRRRPEVVDRVLLVGQDSAIGDEDVVDANTLAGVWQMEGVVHGRGSIGIGEAVQVPVGL